MRSTLLTLGIALLVSLTLGSSVIASGSTAVDAGSSAETGTVVSVVEGDSGLVLAEDGAITTGDREIGLNPNARYTFGDESDPAAEHAFSVRASSENRDELRVQYVDTSGAAVDHVRLTFHTASGREAGRIDFDDRGTTLALDRNPRMLYVVMTIDTTGMAPGQGIPGRLTFTV